MVILHIAYLTGDKCSGVNNAVTQHIVAQQMYADVGLVNIFGADFCKIKNQFAYCKKFKIKKLPKPFGIPDLVVFHELYRFPYIQIYKQLKTCGIPYIIVPHGGLTDQAQKRKRVKKAAANILFFNDFFKCAAAIHFLTKGEATESKFNTDSIISGNGVNLPQCHKTFSDKSGMNIIYIGRLEIKVKGLDLLLNAVCRIKDFLTQNNCKLEIYGPGTRSEKKRLQRAIDKNNIGNLVSVHSEIFGVEKEHILLDADCYIQTSRTEGMPIGIMEALSYGLPCIVTVGTRMAEIIDRYKCGWTSASDSAQIACAIVNAVRRKSDLPCKGKNAVRCVKENFLWDAVAKRTLNLYYSFINPGDAEASSGKER